MPSVGSANIRRIRRASAPVSRKDWRHMPKGFVSPVPALARWLLGLGIVASVSANVAHGLGHGMTGAVVAAWPAVALVGSYKLFMMIVICSAREPASPTAAAAAAAGDGASVDGPLQAQAAEAFAGEIAAGRVPSVRVIRAGCTSASHAPSECART
jgi:hypothetical protein